MGGGTNDCLFYALYDNCTKERCSEWREQLRNFLETGRLEQEALDLIKKSQLNLLQPNDRGVLEWELLHLAFKLGVMEPPVANIIVFTQANQLQQWSPSSVYFHPNGIENTPFILVANEGSAHFVNLEFDKDIISQAVRLFLHMKAEIIQLEKESTKWQRDFFQAKGEKEHSEDLAKAMKASMSDPSSSAALREASLEAQLKESQTRKRGLDAGNGRPASMSAGGRRVVDMLDGDDTDEMSDAELREAIEIS
jgi:hypothetical protein